MKYSIAVTLVLITAFAAPAAAQTKEQNQSWLAARLTEISPVTLNSEGKVDYAFTALIFTLDATSLADLAISRYAMDRGAIEANPLMRWGMEHRPLDIFFRVTSIAAANYCLKLGYCQNKTVAYVVAGAFAASYVWLVQRNYQISMQISL